MANGIKLLALITQWYANIYCHMDMTGRDRTNNDPKAHNPYHVKSSSSPPGILCGDVTKSRSATLFT